MKKRALQVLGAEIARGHRPQSFGVELPSGLVLAAALDAGFPA
ncbi:MAG: hypothetical protein ABSG26_05645 [Bryobacteraceae bacterium]